MIMGDAPYQDEENTGRPFSGIISSKIDQIISAIGSKREEVYLTYLFKCRPVKGSIPGKESKTCYSHSWEQIRILKPKIIIALGNYSTQYLLTFNPDKIQTDLNKLHGAPILCDLNKDLCKFYLIPTYNPGNKNDLALKTILDDMKSVKTLLNGSKFFL